MAAEQQGNSPATAHEVAQRLSVLERAKNLTLGEAVLPSREKRENTALRTAVGLLFHDTQVRSAAGSGILTAGGRLVTASPQTERKAESSRAKARKQRPADRAVTT